MKSTIPILTPLRGIAAICVVFFHARLILFPQWMKPLQEYTHFIENAYLWVDLFFILSGFVMMHVYQSTFSSSASLSSWGRFMWLRFSRIYPLFLLTLLVLIAWEWAKSINSIGFYGGALFDSWGVTGIPAFQGPFNRSEAILPNILMLHGVWESDLSWNISSWSLSVEWLSYMAFPFLVPLLTRRNLAFVIPILCLVALSVANATKGSLDITGGGLAFIRAISSFVLGAWLHNLSLSQRHRTLLSNDFTLLTVLLGCIALLHLPNFDYHNVIVVVAFALLVLVSAHQSERSTPVFKLLDNRITRFLGDISYSLYLWHAVLLLAGIEIIQKLMPEQLALWYSNNSWISAITGASIFAIITIGVSSLSYFNFEKPVMRWLRGFFRKQETPNSPLTNN